MEYRSSNERADFGYVYILKNQWMEGIVKIGKTINIKKRMDDLYNTSVPAAFRALYVSKLPIDKMDDTEKTLHLVFSDDRIKPKREFFQLDEKKIQKGVRILKLVETENVTDEVNGNVRMSLPLEEEPAWEENSEMVRRARRPNLNFFLLGFESGENLYWKDNDSIFVTIITERQVKFNDKLCYLTMATKEVLGTDAPVAPAPYWRYKGRLLSEIYNEFYNNPTDGE